MISRLSRPLCLFGAAAFLFAVGPVIHAQITAVDWTGAVDSNYLNAANWSGGVVPGTTSDIRLLSTVNNRVINLTNTGTSDYTQYVNAIQNGASLGYTLNLTGNSSGQLIYDIVGRGTHPFNTSPTQTYSTGTATLYNGTSGNRLAFYWNLSYATVNFVGSTANPGPGLSTSGLTYAKATLINNSRIDTAGLVTPRTNYLMLGGLSFSADSTVYLGQYAGTLSALCAAGEEEVWAGHMYQDANVINYVNATVTPTGTTPSTQKWGKGTTRVASTGLIEIWAGMNLREAGQYLVDGVHNGPITANTSSGSVLGGKGTINGAIWIGNGASLAPAGRNATGSLTINGDVTLNGALSVELFSATQFDHLQLNGNLILTTAGVTNTSNLTVGITDTFPLRPATYRIANFTGVTGAFALVSLPSSQGLSASYVMGTNYIDIIFKQVAFADNPLLTGNYGAIASAVDTAVLNNQVPGSFLENLNRQPSILFFKEVFDQLSPTCYYSWYPAAVTRTNSMISTIEDRLSQKGQRVKGALDAYVMTNRQESSIDSTELADYTNYDAVSTLGGVDMLVAPGFTLGGMFEYANTRTDLNQLNSTSVTDSLTVGLYAQARRGEFEVQVAGFGGFDEYKSKRNVQRTKLAAWANSDTKGQRLGGSISTSYTKKFKWFEVSPSIGGFILNWNVNEFQEKDAAEVNLLVKEQKRTAYAARGGLRLSQTYSTTRGSIRPFVNVGYQREFGGETRKIKAELFGSPMTTKVPSIQKTGVRLDFGVDWSLAEKLSAQVRYVTEAGGASDESVGVRGGLNFAF